MIDAGLVREILAIYKKHGWTLRRVLLSGPVSAVTPDIGEQFGGVPVTASPLDGFWFSRPSKGTSIEAWELRHISSTPYALLEGIGCEAEEGVRDAILVEIELRMQKAVMRKN